MTHSAHSYDAQHGMTPTDTLGHVEAYSLAVRTAENTLKRDIIPTYHSWYNTFTPIHRLPKELFGDIILCTLDNPTTLLNTLHLVSLVARSWRQVVVETPSIWTTLASSIPRPAAEIFLQRSKNMPLSIHCHILPPLQFVDAIKKHSERWESVFFMPPRGYRSDIPIDLLRTPLPILERLTMVLCDRSRTRLQLSEGRPLQMLQLGRISMNWTCARLKGLRSLILIEVDFEAPSELLTLVRSCPALEVLNLIQIDDFVNSEADSSHYPDTPIHLPNLRSFHTESVSMTYLQPLLSVINAPNCRNISLEGGHLEGLLDSSPDHNTFLAMHHIFNSSASVSAVLNPHALEITGRGPEGDSRPATFFEFRPSRTLMYKIHFPNPLLAILTSMPTSSCPLDLSIESVVHNAEEALSALHRLQTLRTLKVLQEEAAMEVVRQLTAKPEADDGWAFPALRILHIVFQLYMEDEEEETIVAALFGLVACGRWASGPGASNRTVFEVILDGFTESDSIEDLMEGAAAFGILVTLR